MRVTATYLYPDFSSKKKSNIIRSKKSKSISEKSFEECLIHLKEQMNRETMKQSKMRNFG